MIIYDPYGELKKVVDEISAMKEAKKPEKTGSDNR